MPIKFGNLISFDVTKIDKTKLKAWVLGGAQLLEPAVITPGNMDKLLFDNLDWLVASLIDQVSQENSLLVVGGAMPSEDHLIAGVGHGDSNSDVLVTQGEVSAYLSQFTNVSAEVQQILKDKPHLVRRLQKFSKEEQQKIVGNPLLLLALQTLLPILFQFLLNRFK